MPTILGNFKKLIRSKLIKAREGKNRSEDNAEANAVFRFKYTLFKELLSANSELFNILADMEQKLKGTHIFGASYIKNQVIRSMIQTFKMVKNLNVLSGNKYPQLYQVLEKINQDIKSVNTGKNECEPPFYVISYKDILKKDADFVGGKSANLGEIQNRLNIPVPEGFAVTAKAFNGFLDTNHLREDILKRKNLIDADDLHDIDLLNRLSREITDLILSKPVPDEIMAEIHKAMDTLWAASPSDVRVAMRSSAIGEDGELSFAGQYLTLLNVTLDQVGEAYKSIIASLYSARSISYRMAKGIKDEDLSMAVACIRMVDSVASGVMYTRHPYNILDDHIIINAVWGLGPYAVDGIIRPDTYGVEKNDELRILNRDISDKAVQLVCHRPSTDARENPDGTGNKAVDRNMAEGIREISVPIEKRSAPALTDPQIRQLADYGRQLEIHYKCAQDIEWALDPAGRIIILQSRPLKINAVSPASTASGISGAPHGTGLRKRPDPISGYRVIIEESEIASQGIGTGTAFHVRTEEDLASFPVKAILIAHHSSPEYTLVMRQCSGIITESGSISGHMAALAREFNVPTLMGLGAENALQDIPHGMEITVDGYGGRVYQGVVTELVAAVEKQEAHMEGTPVHEHLKKIAGLMLPLYLINPKAPDFTPSGCKTLHDIARFCHEYSYIEMFNVSDMASKRDKCSFRLSASLPIDLHIIDLGSGIKPEGPGESDEPANENTCRGMVSPDQIQSVPFLALMKGMLHKDLNTRDPKPVNFSGFLSVMQEQMISPGHVGDRFGDRSYAIIADKYLNFSSRVGYHYSVVDAYCGETVNKNYISFSFKGGAADDIKRNRRVRAIALILKSFDFAVDVKEDKVDARFQKYPCPLIQDRLDILGRLLLFTRQMDMLMTTEDSVKWVADNFIAGNYKLAAQ
jgi:pyruvate,water dikinase